MTRREDLVAEACKEVYLGDGLYCSFDGYQFVLRSLRPDRDHYDALGPNLLDAFERHRSRVNALIAECHVTEDSAKAG